MTGVMIMMLLGTESVLTSPELRKSNARTKDNIVLAPAPVSRRQKQGKSDITSSVEREESARPSQPVRSRFDYAVGILDIVLA